MAKVLAISDVHLRHWMFSNKIQKQLKPDLTIFLGDYFDDFGDTMDRVAKTAQQLKWSLNHSDRIHLLGNHDVHYIAKGSSHYACSGGTFIKQCIIDDVIDSVTWRTKFKFIHCIDNILFSHAGINKCGGWFIPDDPNCFNISNESKHEQCFSAISKDEMVPMLEGSSYRGFNWVPTGMAGVTWMDWRELEVLDNYYQVVGHSTHLDVAVQRNLINGTGCFNIDIDTHSHHILLIDTEKKEFLVYDIDRELKISNERNVKDIICRI